jgi:uncharacterized protein YbgA (DUF1722 family)/uncharacterized protein YbbK (DUF523 family)
MRGRRTTIPNQHSDKIPLGISSCLIGDRVRFDGGHKRHRFVTDVLGDYVVWITSCPEIGAGMGVPRETIRLARDGDSVRVVGNKTGEDWTDRITVYSTNRAEELAHMKLRGYVLKKDSPSCGMERVRLYDTGDVPSREGVGVFARVLMARYPNLPVEEEGRLNDARIRENFITRIFTYDRWLRLVEHGPAPRDIVEFHTQHKMLVMAHSQVHYTSLGQLVARAGAVDMAELIQQYEAILMQALRQIASPGQHANVMEHLAGFLKRDLGPADKAELHNAIHQYRVGHLPLIAPLLLLYHHIKHLRDDWLDAQVYLEPYPAELALRSSI